MPASSHMDDVAALQEIAREFAEGFNTGDVDRTMRYYGDRYVDVNLRHPEQTNQELAAVLSARDQQGRPRSGPPGRIPRRWSVGIRAGTFRRDAHRQRRTGGIAVFRDRPQTAGWLMAGGAGHGRAGPGIRSSPLKLQLQVPAANDSRSAMHEELLALSVGHELVPSHLEGSRDSSGTIHRANPPTSQRP